MIKRISILLLIFLPGILLRAQDIHFSQFSNSPVLLNPAQTGFFNGAHRFTVNSRTQWGSFTVPYKTFSFSYDMQPAYRLIKNDMLGIGFWFFGDKAGDSDYGTINANLSLSYIISLNSSGNSYLGLGFMGSWAQRSMSYNDLYFDEQFDGEKFNPSLPTMEDKGNPSYNYFDYSLGAHWRYNPDKTHMYNAGISLSHITRPSQNFLDREEMRLPVKTILYGDLTIPFTKEQGIIPGFMAAFQGAATEIVVGSNYRIKTGQSKYSKTSFSPGVYYRFNDALILSFQLNYDKWNFGVSYDINTSDLKTASNGFGALEISINYKLPRTDIHRREAIPCPIF